jgi:Fe-S-cluster containining protein
MIMGKRFKCERCGFCCTNFPRLDELPGALRVMLETVDPDAIELFRSISPNGICPNLAYDGKVALCRVYGNRCGMCWKFRCDDPSKLMPGWLEQRNEFRRRRRSA